MDIYHTLFDYWFSNESLWFDASIEEDIHITSTFKDLFLIDIDEDKLFIDKKYAISIILLYDQITRHVFRTIKDDNILFWNRFTFIEETHSIALNYCIKVYFEYKEKLTPYEFCFVLMPLRHSNDFRKIKYVLNESWNKINESSNNNEISIYKKYIKATYERAFYQSDHVKMIQFYNFYSDDIITSCKLNKIINILKNTFATILDNRICDEKKIKTIDINSKSDSFANIFYNNFNKLLKIDNKYILSISGGVDSMICSYILKIKKYNFDCVFINYNNRKESSDEELFVIEWCKSLNVNLYVRKIDEINRNNCMKYNLRELYENYTRDIRLFTYSSINDNPNVILGHNQDDCIENIFTNITQKTKYENLFGMDFIVILKFNDVNINFFRPLLNIDKQTIYLFASLFKIPFLFDSTPKWSQRGKIRDIVRPAIENWNKDSIVGLIELNNILKNSFELIDSLVNLWFEKITNNTLQFSHDQLIINNIFWKKLFVKLNFSFSIHSISNFINLLHKIKHKTIKLHKNQNIKYELNKKIQLNILYSIQFLQILFIKRD